MSTTLDILGYFLDYRDLRFLRLDGKLRVDKRNAILQ